MKLADKLLTEKILNAFIDALRRSDAGTLNAHEEGGNIKNDAIEEATSGNIDTLHVEYRMSDLSIPDLDYHTHTFTEGEPVPGRPGKS